MQTVTISWGEFKISKYLLDLRHIKLWLTICFDTNISLVVVIVWELHLQLPVQSVPINTKVVSSNPVHGEVYSIQHYVIKFVSDLRQVGGFLSGNSGFLHQ